MLEGAGIGLRKEHFDDVCSGRPGIAWFEAISENFMIPGGRPRAVLERVRRDWPVALHGVSLSIGSAERPTGRYLKALRDLVEWVEPALVSDHLCWTAIGGHNSHDLLPLPYTEEAARVTIENVRQVQDTLGRRILLENISSYLEHASSDLTEADFLCRVAIEADCEILLDVNNLYVNAVNHGWDPIDYLCRLPLDRVNQVHLGGHEVHRDYLLDTHDAPITEAVWELYRVALDRIGRPVPTLIEWDARVPPLDVLLEMTARADSIARELAEVPDAA